MHFIRLGKNHHQEQTMITEILMVEVPVGAAMEALLHTRNQTLPLTISLLTKQR